MAKQSFQVLDKATFDAHAHNYRRLTRIGADADDKWGSPTWADIVDDADTHASENVDLEACGVTVSTSPTSTPV